MKGLSLSTIPYLAVRLVLARGSLCSTSDGRQRLASRLDAGYALCPAERAFACLLLGAVDTTGRYLMPEFGNFFFYAAVIAIVCVFPRGFFGRAQ